MKYLISVLILIIISSCGTGSDGDIYITGYNAGVAMYWKNGIQTNLDNGGKNADAEAIYIDSNNNVYVAGSCVGEAGSSVPCYWKNGTRTLLDQLYGWVNGISLIGNDLYLSGRITVDVPYGGGTLSTSKAGSWKNTTLTVLNGSTTIDVGWANSLFVSEGSVYIAGCNEETQVYWKDGTANTLPVHGELKSIYIKDGVFYASGDSIDGLNFFAVYYKNGDMTKLSTPNTASLSIANSIFVDSNNDIYIAGYYKIAEAKFACYWKNGQLIDLPDGMTTHSNSEANQVIVKNGNVYVVGDYYNLTTSKNIAAYWKNGEKTDLTFVESEYARAISIFIK
ncbi:MAG: hypothetical protein NTY22_02535 [Proteobacteria bacterium]|nr:hypothetical protein [Pseudomonadota bacterium]